MFAEFRGFLTKTNALALAVGVIIGGAVSNVVAAVGSDFLMPIISLVIPGGNWRDAKIAITPKAAILYGHFLGAVIDFLIISSVVFLIVRALIKPAPVPPAEPMKQCPECLEMIPSAARRCRACATPLT
jgi:large conductance mechanosensitive channel